MGLTRSSAFVWLRTELRERALWRCSSFARGWSGRSLNSSDHRRLLDGYYSCSDWMVCGLGCGVACCQSGWEGKGEDAFTFLVAVGEVAVP